MKTSMYRSRSGFTLIELLVVIAIIAILAAILFPVFAKVREKARQTSCLSNEKQLGLAIIQYGEDYDETYPVTSGMNYNCSGWAAGIYPYVKSVNVFECPDDPTVPYNGSPNISYAINIGLIFTNKGSISAETLAGQSAPASTVLLCEVHGQTFNPTAATISDFSPAADMDSGYWGGQLPNNSGSYATGSDPIKPLILAAGGAVHTGGANYLACDGHAKWLRSSAISGGSNATSPNLPEVAPSGSGNPTPAAGTSCMDNTVADDSGTSCNNQNTAVLTFSSI